MTTPMKSFLSPSFKPKASLSFDKPLDLDDTPLSFAPEAPAPPLAGRRRGLVIEPEGVLLDSVQERPSIRPDKKKMEEKIREHIELFNTPGVSMDSIHFCFFSPQEVANFSVVELKEPKLEGRGGLYDLRMGPSERNETCETCGERREKCPGHFGHIPLNVPIPHPLCSKSIIDFLHCFCYKCHRLVMTEDEIKLKKLHLLKGNRFEAILEEIKKNLDRCMHPDCKQILIKKYTFDDDKYYKTLKTGEKKPLVYSEIVDIFNDIAEDDLALLGLKDERYTIYNKDNTFEDSLVYPSRLILKNLPVLPPCARAYQVSNNEKSHDDLTLLYKDIIVHNNELGKPEKLNEMSFQTELIRMVTKIHILFDNDKKKVPKPSGKQPYYGIKERISGKHGHIRKYLLGKRTNFSARTVIGGDNTIGVNEVAIPPQVATNLSVPIEVTLNNLKHCQSLLNEGKVNWIWKPNGHKENDAHLEEFTNTDPTYYRMDDMIILPREDGSEDRCDIYTFLMGKHPSWFDASGVVIEKEKVSNELSNYQVVRREYIKTPSEQKPESSFYEGLIPEKKYQSETCILQETLKPPRIRKTFPLKPGYKIERQVQDGDWVVFNRQPTLWKGSMQSKQVKVLPGKTFRMNLASTEAFNADHDGDKQTVILRKNHRFSLTLSY